MLLEILSLSHEVSAIVCYVPDTGILQEIKRYVARLYDFDMNYTEFVNNANDIKRIYRDALIPPLLGDRWYIELDLDKVNPDNVVNIVRNLNYNSFSLMYTTHYGVYKKLADNKDIKDANNTYMLYGGVLSAKDIYVAYDEICKSGLQPMSEQLLGYVVGNYRYDVPRVFALLQKMRSGEQFRNRTDIVAAVGLGSISALSFVVDILSADLSTERKRRNAERRWFQILRDLLQDIKAPDLLRQLQRSCEDVYVYKDLQMRGLVVGCRKDVEDEAMLIRVSRVHRFENRIIESVGLMRVMWLRNALACPAYKLGAAEEQIMRVLYSYLAMWCVKSFA